MAKPLVRSEMAPRFRMTPEEQAQLAKHLAEFKKSHPSTTLSGWIREAIELKIRVDRENAKALSKTLKRITK